MSANVSAFSKSGRIVPREFLLQWRSPVAATLNLDSRSGMILPPLASRVWQPRAHSVNDSNLVRKIRAENGTDFATVIAISANSNRERAIMELAPARLDPKTRLFYVRTLAVLNEAG